MGVNGEVQEKLVGFQPKLIVNQPGHYCPGCQYGVLTRLLAEVIEELGIEGDIIGVSAVGCSIFIHAYLDIDFIDALHGRAPEVASGVKAANFGKKIVFTLQGDGDLAAIGMGDLINAMARGEHLTTIFLNNANYGTTGGQMAPTTIIGQKSTTTPYGRREDVEGYPIHVAELVTSLHSVVYSARCAMNTVKNVRQTKKAIAKAMRIQMQGLGYGFVEVLSACPSGWKMSPMDSLKWIEEKMIAEYPLGVFKDETDGGAQP
ncbi:MAG: 2-oxoglutarate oxidoreductase [Desulfobacteraceae bacterium]|nr:2-oxoglutarate oxidoreductase [Desulfobacteraceae bacterium]